jgi:MFS family permease
LVTRSSIARGGPIPALIKRNTILLAATQAFVGIGTQMPPALGPIIMVHLVGSATLAGLSTSIQSLSRFLIAYPIGWVADAWGRRAALFIGQGLCLVGTIITGLSVLSGSLADFVLGSLVFGLGVGAGQQLRLAAADLYPPARRAEGLGLVLTGSLVGALGGPALVKFSGSLGAVHGLDPLALTWFLIPLIILPGTALIFFIHPDPREVAANLARYYPGLVEPARAANGPSGAGFRAWVSHYPLLSAFMAGAGAQGVMMLMMVMTSLALSHHGHDLPAIASSIALHTVGMFGFSLPIGRLTDRLGRRAMMIHGCIITAVGGCLVVLTDSYWGITLGTFLVGVGWCCINIASSAMIADLVAPGDRGRAIGTNDSLGGVAAITLPLLAGPIVEQFGLHAIALISTVLMLIPIAMLLPLHEGRMGGRRAAAEQRRPAASLRPASPGPPRE